jgi:hypothetical protein
MGQRAPSVQLRAADEAARARTPRTELDQSRRALFLRDEQVTIAEEDGPFSARSIRIRPRPRQLITTGDVERDRGHDTRRRDICELCARRRLLKEEHAAGAVSADRFDLRVMLGEPRAREARDAGFSPVETRSVFSGQPGPRRDGNTVANRKERHGATSSMQKTDARDFAKRHVDHPPHAKPTLFRH